MNSIAGEYILLKNSLATIEEDSIITLYDRDIFIILSDSKWSEDSPEFRMTSWGFGPSDWVYDSLSNKITLNTDDEIIIEEEILPLYRDKRRLKHQIDSLITFSTADSVVLDSLKTKYDLIVRKLILYCIGDRKSFWGTLQLEIIDSNTLRIADPIGLRELGVDTLLEVIRANPDEDVYFRRYPSKHSKYGNE